MIPDDLLQILRCVECGATVSLDREGLTCDDCGVRYPIRDGVPIMLPSDRGGAVSR